MEVQDAPVARVAEWTGRTRQARSRGFAIPLTGALLRVLGGEPGILLVRSGCKNGFGYDLCRVTLCVTVYDNMHW